MSTTLSVSIEDLWAALDALDSLPDTHGTEWYQRLERAANEATQLEALDRGLIKRH